MNNRINRPISQGSARKYKKCFLNDRAIERTGALHYNLSIPFDCGPCYQFERQTLSWQKGWKLTAAFYEGHQAGMDGKTLSDNPYAQSSTTAPTHLGLAEEWRKGYRAGYTALKT